MSKSVSKPSEIAFGARDFHDDVAVMNQDTQSVSDIELAQTKLCGLGLLDARQVSGKLDDNTRRAIERLQEREGLLPSGQLDEPTVRLLQAWTCGTSIDGAPATEDRREFVAEFSPPSAGFNKTELTYSFDPIPANVGRSALQGINTALAAWSAVTPINFTQRTSGADVRFRFDGLLTNPSDNTTSAIPPWALGFAKWRQMSLKAGVTWSAAVPLPPGATDILAILLHEIGHILGLNHTTNREGVMYPAAGARTLSADDIEAIQSVYGARPLIVPGWFGASTTGADLAVFDFQQIVGSPTLDLIVGHIDNPAGADTAYYRVGWDLDPNGIARGGWSPIVPMGGPLGHDCQGMALAVGYINGLTPGGASAPDIVFVRMDNPAGENKVIYRIGFDADASGLNATWGPDIEIPGPWGHETAGLAAALYDLDGNGRPELVIAWIDDPGGDNKIYYKVGWNLDLSGTAASWSEAREIPGWVGTTSGGLGIALTDVRGNGRPDMVVFWVDNPEGDNAGYVRVGRDMDQFGYPVGGWDAAIKIPGWWGTWTTGAGAALVSLRGLLRPDLIVLNLDAPEGEDQAHYRVLAPPLPTWNVVRRLPNTPAGVARLAAQTQAVSQPPGGTASGQAIVVATRMVPAVGAGSAAIVLATWDQRDLNENQGSDIVEFAAQTFANAARGDSAIALASRIPTQVDAFWIGTDHLLRTTWGTVGTPGSPASGPVWNAVVAPAGARVARPQSIPGAPVFIPPSPIAAASIHPNHIAAFAVGVYDEIIAQSWTQAGNWIPAKFRPESWPARVTALAAAKRKDRVYLYWVDGAGAIWEGSVDDQSNFGPIAQILAGGTVPAWSNLVAVSRNDDQMDLFWLRANGWIMSAWWSTGTNAWSNPFRLGGPTALTPGHVAAPNTSVAAVHAGNQRLQVFWEEADRSIWTSWWAPRPDGFAPPWTNATAIAATPANSAMGGQDMVAVSREPEFIRLFFVASGRIAAETFWGKTP